MITFTGGNDCTGAPMIGLPYTHQSNGRDISNGGKFTGVNDCTGAPMISLPYTHQSNGRDIINGGTFTG